MIAGRFIIGKITFTDDDFALPVLRFGRAGNECEIEHATRKIVLAIAFPVVPIRVDQLDWLDPFPNIVLHEV